MTKAMSTWLSDAFDFVFRLLVFILFGNPLSMWFINLLFPKIAATFARNELYFGPKIYAFYEKYALKWPFYWAKQWMVLEKLSSYGVEQQVQYFLKVSFKNKTEVKTLDAMKKHSFWPDTFEILFFKYGNKKLPLKPETHWKKVGECSVGYWVDVTVADFMMRHTRLSYNALEVAIKRAMNSDFAREELHKYLTSGALNESQLYLLIDAVANDSGSGDFQMLGVLIDYVKRYNLRKEHWQRIKEHYPRPFIELLEEAAHTIEQAKVVRSLQNTPEGRDTWRKFCCATQDILPVAQGKMALWQYDIFHDTGHTLNNDAILTLLRRPDEKLWRLIFERENIDEDIQMEISSNIKKWPIYQEVIKSKQG